MKEQVLKLSEVTRCHTGVASGLRQRKYTPIFVGMSNKSSMFSSDYQTVR